MGSHEPINYLDSLQTEQATSFLHLIKVDEGAVAVFSVCLYLFRSITLTITSVKVFSGVIAVVVTMIIAIKKRLK